VRDIYYSIKSSVWILCHYSAEFSSMTKNVVTPEVIEAIMTKIADKFTDALNSIMSQFKSMLTNTVNAQLAVINSRLDDIETRLINQPGSNMSLVGNNAKESLSTAVECTSRIMMELEREKDAKKTKSLQQIMKFPTLN